MPFPPSPNGPVDLGRPVAGLLRDRLRGFHAPVIIVGDRAVPAASLWSAARGLVAQLRAAGLQRGDRILVASRDDLLVAVALVAGLSGGFATALVAPRSARLPLAGAPDADGRQWLADTQDVLGEVDARVAVCAASDLTSSADPPAARAGLPGWVAVAGLGGLADPDRLIPRPAVTPPDPDVALLLHTSGSTGDPTWVALSEANLDSVLQSHLPALFGDRWVPQDRQVRPAGVLVSVLPWTHAFGVVLDLLPALLCADVVLRDRTAGADPDRLSDVLARAGAGAWLNAVPLTLRRFVDARPDAAALLGALGGGIVGGAVCDAVVCAALSGSALRIGYGLTEAGPGVCLADPGAFTPGLIGTPVGCDVEIVDHRLAVTGPNVSLGILAPGGRLVRRDGSRLVTGDMVRASGASYALTGRVHDVVKLSSGRWLALTDVEAAVQRSTGLACAAQSVGADGLVLLVDGDLVAAGAVRAWVHIADAPWTGHVRDVRALPSQAWPRTAKGEVVRRVPDAPRTVPQPEVTGLPR